MSTLLMTATINSSYFGNIATKITDTEERRQQYQEALEKYIRFSCFSNIVFAENSEENLDELYFTQLANSFGKKIEFLEFPGNKSIMEVQGKSYGEASLILNSFQNSKLIEREKSVYKVTGRVWINNINQLINEKTENCFIAHNFKSWVLTSFFKVRCDDFYKALLPAPELCNDNTPDWLWCIEHTYYELLKNVINPINSFIILY